MIAIILIIAALFATLRINHESMGLLWLIGYGLPVLCLAFVAWAAASRHLSDGPRRATMVATILLACGVWMAVRTEGITHHVSDSAWRWMATSEDRLLVHASDKPTAITSAPTAVKAPAEPLVSKAGGESTAHEPASEAAKTGTMTEVITGADWPGFRGLARDILYPDKMFAVGGNYTGHLREMGMEPKKSASMPFFLRPPTTTLVGPGNTVRIPTSTKKLVFRNSLAIRPTVAGALYGAGAGLAINAGWRIACPVSTPWHALGAHGAAIIATVVLGALIGRVLGNRRLPIGGGRS